MDIKQPSLSKPSWRLHGGFLKVVWMPLEGSWTALGDSWKALGRLLEASKRHLGLKPMKGRIFGGFLENFGNFGRPRWRRFNIKNRIFLCSKRASKIKLILKAFLHRYWDDFQGSGNVKNEQKRGRVALFLIFGGCNIRRRFGAVLKGSWGGFWELFGRFWLDFGALKGVQF